MLNIIAHKNNLYNNKEFIDKTLYSQHHLQGVMLDVVMTKDQKILVFSSISANQTTLNTIQNSNVEGISYFDIFYLEDALKAFENTNFKIIINMVPLNEVTLIENYQQVVKDNERYTRVVYDILKRYPKLNLYVCSASYNLIYMIKQIVSNLKIGVILNVANSSYVDVDFYIFAPEMLERKILEEQLAIGKEVMIQMQNSDDMSKVTKFILQDYPNYTLMTQFQYITNHADLFYLMFNHSK